MQVNILDAKNSLSRLVAAAEQGEEVVLARNGVPVAQLVKYQRPMVKPPGAWRGTVKVKKGWDSPEADAEVARLLEGDDASRKKRRR
jgi:prevent-host-death family protein